MKNTPILLLAAALIAGGCQSSQTSSTPVKQDNVAVSFQDADKFTDARESFGASSSQYYLDQLSEHLKKVAGKQLTTGQKLDVTINDIDLAGDFIPGNASTQDIRVIKEIYIPRVKLTFKLLDAEGKVLKEGARSLSDLNYMSNIGLIDRDQPLFYDKALLTNWVRQEIKS